MVRNATLEHEKKATDKTTKLWDNIKKLKAESIICKDIILYNLDGSKMDILEQKQPKDFWKTVYRATKKSQRCSIWRKYISMNLKGRW